MPCKSKTQLVQQYGDDWENIVTKNSGPFDSRDKCNCCDCGVNTDFTQYNYQHNNAQYGLSGIGWYFTEGIMGLGGGGEPPRYFTGAYDGYSNTYITGGTEYNWSYTNGTKPVNSFWASHTKEYRERLRWVSGIAVDIISLSYKFVLFQCVNNALIDITGSAVVQKPEKRYCINVDPDYGYLEGAQPPSIVNTIDIGTALDYAITYDPGPPLYQGGLGFGYPIRTWCGGFVSGGSCETASAPNNCAQNLPTGGFTQGQYRGSFLSLIPGLFTNCT